MNTNRKLVTALMLLFIFSVLTFIATSVIILFWTEAFLISLIIIVPGAFLFVFLSDLPERIRMPLSMAAGACYGIGLSIPFMIYPFVNQNVIAVPLMLLAVIVMMIFVLGLNTLGHHFLKFVDRLWDKIFGIPVRSDEHMFETVLTPNECRKIITDTIGTLPAFYTAMRRHKENHDDAWISQFLSEKRNLDMLRQKIVSVSSVRLSYEEIVTYVTWYFREMI